MNKILRNRHLLSDTNYIVKAKADNDYWFGIFPSKIEKLSKKNVSFNLIITGDNEIEDFYVIPYTKIRHLLTIDNLVNSTNRKRWVGSIKYHQLKFRNSIHQIDISEFYSNSDLAFIFFDKGEDAKNDYSIANRTIEIKARQKQSKFRSAILSNYRSRCCITGIALPSMLIASHIVPWSHRIDSRLDPSNGLCLSVMVDKLFDQGFITIDSNFKLIVSKELKDKTILEYLDSYIGISLTLPKRKLPKKEYLEYHRKNVFK